MSRKLISLCLSLLLILLISPVSADWAPGDGHKMHFPQLPDEVGWDVNATSPQILADDWRCSETGVITDIHFWGSWRDLDGDQIGDVGNIDNFIISIHSDIPADQSPTGYSMPGPSLRDWTIPFSSVQVVHIDPPMALEGWYDPIMQPPNDVIYNDHGDYYQYNIVGLNELVPDPFVQEDSTIYWLNISAVIPVGDPQQWGWKTSTWHFNDDAVISLPPDIDWTELFEPPRMNNFFVSFDPQGMFAGGSGTNYYDDGTSEEGWYFYPNTGWWNIWFYDNPPNLERKKRLHIEFTVVQMNPDPTNPGFLTLAVNFSTPEWPPGPPPVPPISPDEEGQYVGRILLRSEMLIGPEPQEVFIDTVIDYFNPEWVSVDVMGMNFNIMQGRIIHECVDQQTNQPQSLDLAFVITGEPPTEDGACCFPDGSCIVLTQADCDAQGGTWAGAGTSCQGDNNNNLIDDACEGLYPMGACCFADGSCIVTYEQACNNAPGATFMGVGTDCIDHDGNGQADICEEPDSLLKWYQPPDLALTGMDVSAFWNPDYPYILADDFHCGQTGPITEIDIWGSWWQDQLPTNPPSFILSIHADIPAADNPHGPWSIPGALLWLDTVQAVEQILFGDGLQEGWYEPPDTYDPAGDTQCWMYRFTDFDEPFIQQGTETDSVTYWLDVQALTDISEDVYFGWKTSREHWNDDAVWILGSEPVPFPPPAFWRELRYPVGHPWEGQSIDLSFAIYGVPAEPEDGACCFPDGSCIVLTQADCAAQGGTWAGAGTSCQGDNNNNLIDDACEGLYPMGACCFTDQSCVVTYEAACNNIAGAEYKADGTDCSDANSNGIADICEEPTGACCLPDGSCIENTQADCDNLGGNWSGAGSACQGDTDNNLIDDACEGLYPMGACCFEDQSCVVTYEAACNNVAGAEYKGDGTDCSDANGNDIADICEEIPPDSCDYYKPPYPDYAPAGMPDFDQKQDFNGDTQIEMTWCGPTALANCFWWFDSKSQFLINPGSPPPPTSSDDYPLVRSYDPAGIWDDHDPSNVLPFVDSMAVYCLTDIGSPGTVVFDLGAGATNWLNAVGLGADYTVAVLPVDDFDFIRSEVLRSQDVILLLGFWQEVEPGYCERIGGHYVTVAGACQAEMALCVSDPYYDFNEGNPPGPPHAANIHNDAQYVSGPHGTMHHDKYYVGQTPCMPIPPNPYFAFEFVNYPIDAISVGHFFGQNNYDPAMPPVEPIPGIPIHTLLEFAVIICPVDQEQGACCFPDGSCELMTEPDCNNAAGSWGGAGTTCLGDSDGNLIDDACENIYPMGACCFEDQSCVVTYEAACNNVTGAEYKGDGTDCTDGDSNGIADICEEGPTGFDYLPGDANMGVGVWPPQVIGSDVTFLVSYFRAIVAPCLMHNPYAAIAPTYFFAAADANGDCSVIGSDVTKMVAYFRGLTTLSWCSDYPPNWPPVPPNQPAGWPGCQTPPLTGKTVIPSEPDK